MKFTKIAGSILIAAGILTISPVYFWAMGLNILINHDRGFCEFLFSCAFCFIGAALVTL